MLFNSPEFLVGFLPVVLAGFFLIGGLARPIWAIGWLVLASLFFYGWWRPEFVLLILGSAMFNYVMGLRLGAASSRALLTLGIAGNLGALGWFKYSGFLAEVANDLAGAGIPVPDVVLPLGLSFYTFQQIAYLVDANSGEVRETSLTHYLLFVTFFPQLIAGPIVHHREMLSQFHDAGTYKPRLENLLLGLSAFSIGLFKKVFIADPLSPHAALAFTPAADGILPTVADAWFGALAYALQMYFDFSGYSDMAVGLGLMFGIRLPINFASPYKAASIVEFWRRWHMTLTRFLTSYIYNPIVVRLTRRSAAAGKPIFHPRKPKPMPFLVQLAMPTVLTMGLAGIWHGAGWQFLVFGLWHGAAIAINHGWRAARPRIGLGRNYGRAGHMAAVLVTFLTATIGLVFFRSESLPQALLIVQAMAGFGGEFQGVAQRVGADPTTMNALEMLIWRFSSVGGALVAIGLVVVWTMPNTAQLLEWLATDIKGRAEEARNVVNWPLLKWDNPAFQATAGHLVPGAFVGVLLAFAALRVASAAPTEFLYFTF